MKQIFIYYLNLLLMLLVVVILMLISVAFLTLMERKLLSFIQLRKGPNKVSLMGIFQPFSDAIKLLSKESFKLMKLNYFYYFFSPIYMLILMVMMWMIYPFFVSMLSMQLGVMYLMCCFSLGVYGLLLTGWSSNSSYSMLGAIRSLSQSLSYEVSLSLIILLILMIIESFSFMKFGLFNNLKFFYLWPLGLIFFISLMAELNRTPFDFSEGESELVSGFNVEYMSGSFILIFLSEYSSILFLSYLFNLMFFFYSNLIVFYLLFIILVNLMLWIRGTFPRFRYDLLMYLCWLMILPITLNYLIYIIMFKLIV